MNNKLQYYKTIPVRLILRKNYKYDKAKRFTLNETNQNIWIPNKHLMPDGTIIYGENIDYVFRKSWRQCNIAGIDINALNRRIYL
jgi:hypothetical protein